MAMVYNRRYLVTSVPRQLVFIVSAFFAEYDLELYDICEYRTAETM